MALLFYFFEECSGGMLALLGIHADMISIQQRDTWKPRRLDDPQWEK